MVFNQWVANAQARKEGYRSLHEYWLSVSTLAFLVLLGLVSNVVIITQFRYLQHVAARSSDQDGALYRRRKQLSL